MFEELKNELHIFCCSLIVISILEILLLDLSHKLPILLSFLSQTKHHFEENAQDISNLREYILITSIELQEVREALNLLVVMNGRSSWKVAC